MMAVDFGGVAMEVVEGYIVVVGGQTDLSILIRFTSVSVCCVIFSF